MLSEIYVPAKGKSWLSVAANLLSFISARYGKTINMKIYFYMSLNWDEIYHPEPGGHQFEMNLKLKVNYVLKLKAITEIWK